MAQNEFEDKGMLLTITMTGKNGIVEVRRVSVVGKRLISFQNIFDAIRKTFPDVDKDESLILITYQYKMAIVTLIRGDYIPQDSEFDINVVQLHNTILTNK
jgi:hypothetical protein